MFKFIKRRAFKKDYARAAADGVLTDEEHERLGKHGVDTEFANKVRAEHFEKTIAKIRDRICDTRRMSPEDEEQLRTLAVGLNIEARFGEDLLMARELWARDNGEQVHFPPVEATFILKASETCYFKQPAVYKQMKTIKTRVGYSGYATSIRIMKGVSYRIGTVRPKYDSQESLVVKSVGQFAITNKRLFHDGDGKSTAINFGRILNVEPYEDGLEISKTSGPNDFFQMEPIAAEYASMLLTELLAAA